MGFRYFRRALGPIGPPRALRNPTSPPVSTYTGGSGTLSLSWPQGQGGQAARTPPAGLGAAPVWSGKGCLTATLSQTAFKSQEKSSRCRSPCYWLAVYTGPAAAFGPKRALSPVEWVMKLLSKKRLAVFSAYTYRFSAVYWRTLPCHWAGPTHFLRD